MEPRRKPNAICEFCQKPYYKRPDHPKSRFCSDECRFASKGPLMTPRTCTQCGKEFFARRSRATRFCSQSCVNAAVKPKPPSIRRCLFCGKTFEAENFSDKRWCSQQCAGAARDQKITRECAWCGKEFTKPPSLAGTYCSRACARASQNHKVTKPCKSCGKDFTVSPCFADRQYCSQNCARTERPPYLRFREKLQQEHRTSIEARMERALQELGIAYDWEHRFGRYWVDFYLPAYNVAIECDEPHWHDNERDAKRDAHIIERYQVKILRFTTKQIEGAINDLLRNSLAI